QAPGPPAPNFCCSIRLRARACCYGQVQPDGEAKQAFASLLGSFGLCLLAKTLDYPPPAPMASVGALAHERWPRWFPRQGFQTTLRPCKGPLGLSECPA